MDVADVELGDAATPAIRHSASRARSRPRRAALATLGPDFLLGIAARVLGRLSIDRGGDLGASGLDCARSAQRNDCVARTLALEVLVDSLERLATFVIAADCSGQPNRPGCSTHPPIRGPRTTDTRSWAVSGDRSDRGEPDETVANDVAVAMVDTPPARIRVQLCAD